MLPERDLHTAREWAIAAHELGRKSSHGSAHKGPKEWAASAYNDLDRVYDLLDEVTGVTGPRPRDLGVVLDWGCGFGRLTGVLAATCKWVFAADASSDAVRGFERTHPNISEVVTDIPALSAPEGSVDLVVSFHVLYSLTPAGVAEAIRQLAGLLAPHGRLILDIPHHYWGYRHQAGKPEDRLPGGWWIHSFGEVSRAAHAAGLWIEHAPEVLPTGAVWWDLAIPRLWSFARQP